MITSDGKIDEEDEDVVIAGSELHEALAKMGYSDYEVVPISNEQPIAQSANSQTSPKKSDGSVSRTLYKKITNIYRCMVKDSKALREQLTTISEAQHLLDDHTDFIKSLLDQNRETDSGINKFLPYLQYAAVTTAGYYFFTSWKPLAWLMTFPALTAAQFKYKKWRSIRDLKRLISEQTELYYAYKRALRILNHYFRMNSGRNQQGFKFTDLGAERLKFLQPIMEKTLKSLCTMSIAYYDTTSRMAELLPGLERQSFHSQITCFDKECFTNCGEVTYNYLRQIFYRFILIQSEMLLSMAVLTHSDTCQINVGMKVDHRIKQLLKLTARHRASMTRTVDAFHDYKLAVVKDRHRGFHGPKWQDLYVRLHLTSHKMQKAYDNVTSVLEDIENHLDRQTDETELLEGLKSKLDDVCMDADKARDLAQLSALIVSKMRQVDCIKEEQDDDHNLVETSRLNLPIVKDTDPEIIDEVFEEYIRERYSDAGRSEAGDDYLERTYKLDKLLSNNLMSELKEALIDKQKDTKERESRALKRMNKNPIQESENVSNDGLSLDHVDEIESNDSTQLLNLDLKSSDLFSRNKPEIDNGILNGIPRPPPPPMPKGFDEPGRVMRSAKENKEEKELEETDRRPKCFVPLPISRTVPLPMFLSNNEETFIGSGENSDEEVLGTDAETDKEDEADTEERATST